MRASRPGGRQTGPDGTRPTAAQRPGHVLSGVLLDILQRTGHKGYVAFLESLELYYPQLYKKVTGKEPTRVFSMIIGEAWGPRRQARWLVSRGMNWGQKEALRGTRECRHRGSVPLLLTLVEERQTRADPAGAQRLPAWGRVRISACFLHGEHQRLGVVCVPGGGRWGGAGPQAQGPGGGAAGDQAGPLMRPSADASGESGLTQLLMSEVLKLQRKAQDLTQLLSSKDDLIKELRVKDSLLRKHQERVQRLKEELEAGSRELKRCKDENYELAMRLARQSEEKGAALMRTRDLQLEVPGLPAAAEQRGGGGGCRARCGRRADRVSLRLSGSSTAS